MGKRGPMTEEAKAARLAKRRATLRAKEEAAFKQLDLIRAGKSIKPKKARRPMTAKQKKAAAARLTKARAVKAANNEAKGVKAGTYGVNAAVVKIKDDNPLSLSNVRKYIKASKEHLSAIHQYKTSNVAKERAEYDDVVTYISNLEAYIRTGVYLDFRYGSNRQHKIQARVTHMAYYPDGSPKRCVGFIYPDVGLWTKEMNDAN